MTLNLPITVLLNTHVYMLSIKHQTSQKCVEITTCNSSKTQIASTDSKRYNLTFDLKVIELILTFFTFELPEDDDTTKTQ